MAETFSDRQARVLRQYRADNPIRRDIHLRYLEAAKDAAPALREAA